MTQYVTVSAIKHTSLVTDQKKIKPKHTLRTQFTFTFMFDLCAEIIGIKSRQKRMNRFKHQ